MEVVTERFLTLCEKLVGENFSLNDEVSVGLRRYLARNQPLRNLALSCFMIFRRNFNGAMSVQDCAVIMAIKYIGVGHLKISKIFVSLPDRKAAEKLLITFLEVCYSVIRNDVSQEREQLGHILGG